MAKCAIIR